MKSFSWNPGNIDCINPAIIKGPSSYGGSLHVSPIESEKSHNNPVIQCSPLYDSFPFNIPLL